MFFSYVALLEAKGVGYVIEKTKKELLTSVRRLRKNHPNHGRSLLHLARMRFSRQRLACCSRQVVGSWKVWPLAHTINFRFIPSNQRVLYINTIQIGYNCFLSLISNRD